MSNRGICKYLIMGLGKKLNSLVMSDYTHMYIWVYSKKREKL